MAIYKVLDYWTDELNCYCIIMKDNVLYFSEATKVEIERMMENGNEE
jgi:hypothetical protein